MKNCPYLSSPKVPMRVMVSIGAALDRAPRPYTAKELSEITGIPLGQVCAFLKCNTIKEKVSSRVIPRPGGGKPTMEYWRGTAGVTGTFRTDDTMDGNIETKIKEGKRPVAWRDGNYTQWSIDETDTVATMRGGSVVRLGKLEGVSYSKQGVTLRVANSMKITFRRT